MWEQKEIIFSSEFIQKNSLSEANYEKGLGKCIEFDFQCRGKHSIVWKEGIVAGEPVQESLFKIYEITKDIK